MKQTLAQYCILNGSPIGSWSITRAPALASPIPTKFDRHQVSKQKVLYF